MEKNKPPKFPQDGKDLIFFLSKLIGRDIGIGFDELLIKIDDDNIATTLPKNLEVIFSLWENYDFSLEEEVTKDVDLYPGVYGDKSGFYMDWCWYDRSLLGSCFDPIINSVSIYRLINEVHTSTVVNFLEEEVDLVSSAESFLITPITINKLKESLEKGYIDIFNNENKFKILMRRWVGLRSDKTGWLKGSSVSDINYGDVDRDNDLIKTMNSIEYNDDLFNKALNLLSLMEKKDLDFNLKKMKSSKKIIKKI